MDDLRWMFTSTEGRIGRGRWWLGTLIIAAINLVISFLILPMFGFNNAQALIEAQSDPARLSAVMLGTIQTSAWASLVLLLIFGYPLYALGIKRRHDRNNNGLDYTIYLGVLVVSLLIQALGIGYSMQVAPGTTFELPMPNLLSTVVNVVMLIYAVYMIVVLGFLRGTDGDNAYGQSPV